MAPKLNALDQFLLEDPETTPVSEYPDRESYLDAMQSQTLRDISERGQAQAFIPESLSPRRKLGGFSQFREGTAPLPKLSSPVEDEAGDLPPSMQTVPDLRAPDLRAAPAAQQIKESAFGNMKLTQPAIQPVPTVGTPVQKTEGTPSAAVAKMTEGAGGDEPDLDRMLSAANWIRAMESTGSAISGKNLRSGIADSLGEQARQVQAMRLKRSERADELAREDAQSKALVSQYQSLAKQGLVPEIPDLDTMPIKSAASLIKTYSSLPGTVAKTTKTQAETGKVEAQTEGVGATTERTKAQTARTLDQIETERLKREDIANKMANRAKTADLAEKNFDLQLKKLGRADAIEFSRQADDPKKGAAGFRNLAIDLRAIEDVAPGFLEGNIPPWLTKVALEEVKAGRGWPSDPRVEEFYTAFNTLRNQKRHEEYGSALTDGEIRASLTTLDDSLLSTPKVLSSQLGRLRKRTGDQASAYLQGKINTYGQDIVSNGAPTFVEDFAPEGIFSVSKSPFKTAAPAPSATGSRGPKPTDAEGKKTLWNKKTGQWVRYTPEQEAKARAADAVED